MRTSTRYLFYYLLVLATVLTIPTFFPVLQTFWFVFAALLIAAAAPTALPNVNMAAIFMATIAAAMLVCLFTTLSHQPIATAVCAFFLILLVMSAALHFSRYYYVMQAINILSLLALSMPASTYMGMQRASAILAGGLTALIWQMVMLPHAPRWQMLFWEKRALASLRLITKDIFACYILPEYSENQYFFERRLHEAKLKYFLALKKLHTFAVNQRIERLQIMFDVLMDIAQLRRRVSDFTTFALCKMELEAIAVAIDGVLRLPRTEVSVERLSEKIDLFANQYQTVLNVAAKEPLPFLLFIASLNHLNQEVGSYV